MKEYMLLIRNEIDHQSGWSEEKLQRFLKACEDYINKLNREGKLKSAQPLIREGTMISSSENSWKLEPFNETKEVIVGYYHVFAKDIGEAISIAKENPEFQFEKTARVEVRPIKMKEVTTSYEYPNP